MTSDIALYIHVPFCRRKCPYCSFVSYDGREADIPSYVCALKKELALRSGGESLSSIYFGGGTPSLVPAPFFGELLSVIHSLFIVAEEAEITIEANPGIVSREYLAAIRKSGVNRLSLGAQSLDDRELKLLGRIHSVENILESVHFARDAGFDNLGLDLIYGLPGQTLGDWLYSLEEAVSLKPEHLSLYALTLEEATPMLDRVKNGSLPPVDPDLSANQYEMAGDILAGHGYSQYEISNWAKPGRECRHNLVYWRNLPYLGVGAAAHSWLDGHRLANTSSLDDYLAELASGLLPAPEMDEKISPELELAETIILGLRLYDGINADEIQTRFSIDIMSNYRTQIEEMAEAGLMEREGRRLRLTRRGRFLSNEIFWRFLPDATCKA